MTAVMQKRVHLGHGTTDYVEAGTGYPVIMLHGPTFFMGGIDWLPCIDYVAAKYRVLAPDFPGWGTGDTYPGMDTFPALVDFVREFQDALSITSSHIVGRSMGGWIAGLLCYESPHRVSKCIQTAHHGFNAPLDYETLHQGMANYDQPPSDEAARAWVLDVSKNANIDLEPILKDRLLKLHDPAWVSAFRDIMHSLGNRERRTRYSFTGRRYALTTVPTLFLMGDHDKEHMAAFEEADVINRLPGSRMTVMNGSGHRPHIDEPELFSRYVLDFLDE